MALVDTSLFEPVFSDLAGKRIGFIGLHGNVGDWLAEQSTRSLFRHFGIEFRDLGEADFPLAGRRAEFDEIVISAQGTMGGDFYKRPWQTRQDIIESGLPITVLPSSFIATGEDLSVYRRVFVRDRESQRLHPECELVPDTAMAYRGKIPDQGVEAETGVFLRADRERIQEDHAMSLGDPVLLCRRPKEYLALASKFSTIVTDRLHFCIAALLLGREVIFLPNSYFKNRSFYETWLTDLCSWRDDPGGISYDKEQVENDLYRYLAGPPSNMIPWKKMPLRESGYMLEKFSDGHRLISADGVRIGKANETSHLVWQLCDGITSVDDMVGMIAATFEAPRSEVARDVQSVLTSFHDKGAITLAGGEQTVAPEDKPGGPEVHTRNQGPLTLVVNNPRVVDGKYYWSAYLDGRDEEREVWFATEADGKPPADPIADPFILVFLMYAMSLGRPLSVTGAPISSGLIYNLHEFQQVWAMWRKTLEPIQISGEIHESSPVNDDAVVAFSGGVDSCYSVFSALAGEDRELQPDITAAVMLEGFDIPLRRADIFNSAAEKSRALLNDLEIPLITLASNARQFTDNWVEEHGLVLGAAMTILSDRFGKGVIAATNPYALSLPVGSHFVTDRLMGSDRFSFEHHGAGVTRLDKIRMLTEWEAIGRNLRVCWSGKQLDQNCRKCRKCVLAALMFDLFGDVPECLAGALKKGILKDVCYRRKLGRLDIYDIVCIVEEADKHGLDRPWLPMLRKVIRKLG